MNATPTIRRAVAGLIAGLAGAAAFAVGPAPVGLWQTIDDATGKPKALVRIADSGGVLSGRVEKVLATDEPDTLCAKCPDERKGKPALGLTIIRNVRLNDGDPGLWDGGDVLDPQNGMLYKVRLKPVDDGRKLEVRGYFLAPLIGRTQVWQRVE